MEHNDYIVSTPRKRVHISKTVWLVIIAVAVLLAIVLWVTLVRYPEYSKLLILFLYTIPSEFLIATIPHEPIIFYYSKLFHPFTVTWVTLLATLFTEYLNYVLIDQLFKIPKVGNLKNHRYFKKFNNYFMKAPFETMRNLTTAWLAAFLVLAATTRGQGARPREVMLDVETLVNTVDGSERCGCRTISIVEEGKAHTFWVTFGEVKPHAEIAPQAMLIWSSAPPF